MVNVELRERMKEWKYENLPKLISRDLKVEPRSDIVAIVGPRRSGKTYFMYQKMIELGKKELYVDFEDIVYRKYTPVELIDAYREVFGKDPEYIFLDEIQNLKDWGAWLRTLHNKGIYKIVVTGSTSSLMINDISRELRGRYRSKLLLPFSFNEYLRMGGINYRDEKESRIRSELAKYMEYGGYPEVIKSEEIIEKKEKLSSIYETTLYRDILDRGNVREREILEFIMRYLISNSGNKVSVTKLHRVVERSFYKVSKRTVWRYYKLIKDSFAIFDILAFTHSRKKEILTPRKIYASDTGIYHHLSTKINYGAAMETLVFLHLLRRKNTEDIEIRYLSENGEVDFVVFDKKGIREGIQVCYDIEDPDTYRRETDALVKFAKKYGCSDLKVITYDTEYEESVRSKKIKFIPLYKYLLS